MTLYILLLLLAVSVISHSIYIIQYFHTRSKKYFNGFLVTTLTNVASSIILSIYALLRPQMIRGLNLNVILWTFSGFVMFVLLGVKVAIIRKIIQRARDPEFYHYNFFGKKVYEENVVKKTELLTIIMTIPAFLLIGAYFVARLINIFLYGHI